MEYKNRRKPKEQNSSRNTEPKNGLTVTKGKGLVRMVGKGGVRVGKKKGGITINMYSVGVPRGGLCNTGKTSSDFTASYYVDGQ